MIVSAPLGILLIRSFTRRLTALVLAAAVMLSGTVAATTPARAQNDDLVRFLLGAAAIAVIVRAIDGNAHVRYIDHRTLPGACLETVRVRGRHVDVYHRGCLRRAGYHSLPHHCEVSLRTHHGRRTGYEARCLHNAGYRAEGFAPHADRFRPGHAVLPGHCSLTYLLGHQRLQGYDGHCLRQAGIRNLPHQCAMTARGGQQIYGADCLRQSGYRIGRR